MPLLPHLSSRFRVPRFGADVCGTAFLTYEALEDPQSHVAVIEGIVNGVKAFANAIILYHAVQIMNAARDEAKKAAAGGGAAKGTAMV